MTIEQGATEAEVKIRTARPVWVQPLVSAGVWFLFSFLYLRTAVSSWALWWLILGCASFAQGFWLRTLGVDLTRESAIVRGIRRQSLPWQQVQAVVPYPRFGGLAVRLILENGKPVRLPAPTTYWPFGTAGYERDFTRIGQWWLTHRGESWRPVQPETQAKASGQE